MSWFSPEAFLYGFFGGLGYLAWDYVRNAGRRR